jgi:predicted phage replisome organizer
MAEIKWIKLSIDIFNNRKIKQIECLPEGDAIIVIWVKLLCLAGTINDSGQIYFTKEIPYTDQMLANQFGRPLTTIQLALKTFEQFGMVEVIDNILCVSNWEKYQSVDRLSEIREYNRLAKQKQRQKKKLLQENVKDMSKTSQRCQDTDIDIDIEEDIEKDNIYISDSEKEISSELDNESVNQKEKPIKKPIRHKHGEYKNVLLSDEDFEKLKSEFPSDYEERIERLSSYMASTGKSYKNHLATIRNWARKDRSKTESNVSQQQKQAEKTWYKQNNDFDL